MPPKGAFPFSGCCALAGVAEKTIPSQTQTVRAITVIAIRIWQHRIGRGQVSSLLRGLGLKSSFHRFPACEGRSSVPSYPAGEWIQRQNSASRIMMGKGMPSSQSKIPLPMRFPFPLLKVIERYSQYDHLEWRHLPRRQGLPRMLRQTLRLRARRK